MTVIVTPQLPGCSCDNFIGWGITGSVYYDNLREEVIKAPNSLEERILIEVEKDIYKRLCEGPQHERLLQYRGSQLFNENRMASSIPQAIVNTWVMKVFEFAAPMVIRRSPSVADGSSVGFN